MIRAKRNQTIARLVMEYYYIRKELILAKSAYTRFEQAGAPESKLKSHRDLLVVLQDQFQGAHMRMMQYCAQVANDAEWTNSIRASTEAAARAEGGEF